MNKCELIQINIQRQVRVIFQGESNFNYVYIESSHNPVFQWFITLMYDEKRRKFCYRKTKILPPLVPHML
jgi:hypothetical protein